MDLANASHDSGHSWFALQVKSRQENTVTWNLQQKGYTCFLPIYKSRRRWSDRTKELSIPLFPGYLFCQFHLNHRLPIMMTPSVIRVVGLGDTLVPVSEEEIASIQRVVDSGLDAFPWPYLQAGQQVRIEAGALCGLEGILLDVQKPTRLVVSVQLLQRSVAVELDYDVVRPIDHGIRRIPAPTKGAPKRGVCGAASSHF